MTSIGTIICHTVSVTNNGPYTDPNVKVSEVLPPGLAYSSHTPTSIPFDPATMELGFGPMAVGQTIEVEFCSVVEVEGDYSSAVNTAIAIGDNVDPNPETNTNTAPIEEPKCDLTLGADFELTCSSIDKISILVSGVAPSTIQVGETIVNPNGDGTFNLTPYNGTVVVITSVDCEGETLTLDLPDCPVASLVFSKSVNPTEASIGDTVTMVLTLINSGPDVATGVTVTDNLPTGYVGSSYTETAIGAGTSSITGQLVTWNAGTVPVGTTTLEFEVTVGEDATFPITNTASFNSENAGSGSDKATLEDLGVEEPELGISKQALIAEYDTTGDPQVLRIPWRVCVDVIGAPQSNIVVTDVVPDGLSVTAFTSDNGFVDSGGGTFTLAGPVEPGQYCFDIETLIDNPAITTMVDIKNTVSVVSEQVTEPVEGSAIIPDKPCTGCVAVWSVSTHLNLNNGNITDGVDTYVNAATGQFLSANLDHTITNIRFCGESCDVNIPVPAQARRGQQGKWAVAAANLIAAELGIDFYVGYSPYGPEGGYILITTCDCTGMEFTVATQNGGTTTNVLSKAGEYKTCDDSGLIGPDDVTCGEGGSATITLIDDIDDGIVPYVGGNVDYTAFNTIDLTPYGGGLVVVASDTDIIAAFAALATPITATIVGNIITLVGYTGTLTDVEVSQAPNNLCDCDLQIEYCASVNSVSTPSGDGMGGFLTVANEVTFQPIGPQNMGPDCDFEGQDSVVDWGDGSATETIAIQPNPPVTTPLLHPYSAIGTYVTTTTQTPATSVPAIAQHETCRILQVIDDPVHGVYAKYSFTPFVSASKRGFEIVKEPSCTENGYAIFRVNLSFSASPSIISEPANVVATLLTQLEVNFPGGQTVDVLSQYVDDTAGIVVEINANSIPASGKVTATFTFAGETCTTDLGYYNIVCL